MQGSGDSLVERAPKDRILDAAEELFAEHGYHGVSIRDIIRKAHVDLALPRYHFGTKEGLLQQVIARRADIHCQHALAVLDAARKRALPRTPFVEEIIDAIAWPVFHRLTHGGPGWRNYIRLLARLQSMLQDQKILQPYNAHYAPLQKQYIDAFQEAMPACSRETIYWAYYYLEGSLTHIWSDTKLIDILSNGLCHSDDFAKIRRQVGSYFAAGFYRLLADERPPLDDDLLSNPENGVTALI